MRRSADEWCGVIGCDGQGESGRGREHKYGRHVVHVQLIVANYIRI